MDASNRCRWRERTCTYPVNALWPFVPPLLEDEIISSWLVRCALDHGCDPLDLTNDIWPGFRIWCTDPDRSLSTGHLDALAKVSGMTTEALKASTLLPVYRLISGAECFPHGVAPWILCLGVRNRSRCGGLQYCPLCFAEREAYYHIQGRLAWHTCCPIHQVALLDRCEGCQAPLCPHLIKPPREDVGHCHRCGFILSSASVEPALPNAAKFQTITDGLFDGHAQRYGNSRLDLCEWFELAHWMLGILRNATRANGPGNSRFFDKLQVNLSGLRQPSTGLPFEYLNPDNRAKLLSNVWSMMLSGPDRLISAAAEEHVSYSLLMPRSCQLPPALAELASALNISQKRSCGHPHPDVPRSPSSVLMRWNRLLRKFQR